VHLSVSEKARQTKFGLASSYSCHLLDDFNTIKDSSAFLTVQSGAILLMNFANLLSQLLTQLHQLPPNTPNHLQHLVIRVQRAKNQAEQGQGSEGLELLVRLRGRLDELEQGLAELQGNDVEGERMWSELRQQAQRAKESLEDELKSATSKIANAFSTSSNGRHSRSSSADLPRRLPSTRQVEPIPSELDAFLSRLGSHPPPSPSQPSLASRVQQRAKTLSEAYSLFLLCTSPSSILPPDQTISSIFRTAASRPPTPSISTSLEARLSTQAHKAYFDDFTNKLSPSTSSGEKQTAWTQICRDLADACLPLIPSRLGGGSVKRQIEEALVLGGQDKEWSVEMSFETLRTLLGILRQLCAPARDAQVTNLVSSSSAFNGMTVQGLIEAVKEILKLADEMQGDLERFRSNAKVALASEEEMLGVLKEEAGERERKAIRGIVEGETEKNVDVDGEIRNRTKAWIRRKRGGEVSEDSEPLTKEAVIQALIDSLFEDQAVGPPPIQNDATQASSSTFPPPTVDNSLPTIFWATSPRLFDRQNTLQALTILACLTTVIPFPTSSNPTSSCNLDRPDILTRLWTILKSEISSPASSPNDSTPTRLAHLSDELIAYRQSLLLDPAQELELQEKERIKNSTDRILRYQDPVFKLLRKRLRDGIKLGLIEGLVKKRLEVTSNAGNTSNQVPTDLKTGREIASSRSKNAKLPSLYSSTASSTLADHVSLKPIKGYERLMERIDETVKGRLTEVWDWVEEVWGDVLEWN